jgi:small subunit ribosomal protein S7
VNNVKPLVELKSKKIRGTLQAIPRPLPLKSQLFKAIKSIVNASKKSNKAFCYALADELIESSNRRSQTFRESQTLHKLAIQSKSFAHYRWL